MPIRGSGVIEQFFGNGFLGAFTAAPGSLAADLVARTINVPPGTRQDTGGWRVFAREKIVIGAGAFLSRNGPAGASGISLAGGLGGGGLSGGILGGSGAGGDGNVSGGIGVVGGSVASSLGGYGGHGAAGGAAGGARSTATAPVAAQGTYNSVFFALNGFLITPAGFSYVYGGAGGAGGGGGSYAYPGGGGGAGGGVLLVAAPIIDLSAGGIIEANGGNGGDGTWDGGSNRGGGGGGGGGGLVILACQQLLLGAGLVRASGGTYGAIGFGGQENGADGTVLTFMDW